MVDEITVSQGVSDLWEIGRLKRELADEQEENTELRARLDAVTGKLRELIAGFEAVTKHETTFGSKPFVSYFRELLAAAEGPES
jgi:hypothetical protein